MKKTTNYNKNGEGNDQQKKRRKFRQLQLTEKKTGSSLMFKVIFPYDAIE